MRLNQLKDEQRWGLLNATIAVLEASKTTPDRMMLEQFEALVQPTQFLEYLRKTMPMTESQLDMITTMHEEMFRRLNALKMLYKGGQRAVDEFNASRLVGLEKRKANALLKAKRGNPKGGGGKARTSQIWRRASFWESSSDVDSHARAGFLRAAAAAAAAGSQMRQAQQV
jgi:hypothetical protein